MLSGYGHDMCDVQEMLVVPRQLPEHNRTYSEFRNIPLLKLPTFKQHFIFHVYYKLQI